MVALIHVLLVGVLAAVLALFLGASGPSCPSPEDIQTDYVKAHFNLQKFQGVWYEAAYHDWTQPISVCGCMRSVKHYRPEVKHIFDNFTLHCQGDHYFANLTFDLTGKSIGHMTGRWNLGPIQLIAIPNTVVAVGVDVTTGEYEWVIEYQCVEVWKHVLFAGVNFYHRHRDVPSEVLQSLISIARQQGIGYWLDHGLGITVVDHSNCTYPPIDEEVTTRLNQDASKQQDIKLKEDSA
ncbi:uncharacterized protein [Watersipora subatra]|uniref:uncharacterized protein n=1 Tax=Watersipora subatra TaxID=2589382 RepID=UPI00355B4D99